MESKTNVYVKDVDLPEQYVNKSSIAYRPQFISNNYEEGRKVISTLETEMNQCDSFDISVAFITYNGFSSLSLAFKDLEQRGIPGRILTTDYQYFSDPKALERLNKLENVTVKMYITDGQREGFHTKGYIFKEKNLHKIVVGSSNMTNRALTINKEWNTKIVSSVQEEYADDVLKEFEQLWNSEKALDFDDFIEDYKTRYKIINDQKRITAQKKTPSIEAYKIEPNSMQLGFIKNLSRIRENGEKRALLISATGTGKTFASAFAMRELKFKRVLFLVHRIQIAKQAKEAFEKIFPEDTTMGIVMGGQKEYDKDYIFATVNMFCKNDVLYQYERDYFDAIVYDEAHHTSADSYKKVMDYFTPQFSLGMTATPDKRDDNIEGKNIYEIFGYQIAYEIRLRDAMEDDLLCPFKYFGISDLEVISDDIKTKEKIENFKYLASDERVENIINQAEYYGFSGERVRGLIFCSRIEEAKLLSDKFNERGLRTVSLAGSDDYSHRQAVIERLAGEECEDALDYIFSVDIFSEGVDVPEINQVIMLRPTQSPIVFIQQLGRGLRKYKDKEYVVVLDFIGNYNNNFMIPIALSGDRTYNRDNIRKYVISGNNCIPGTSTIHFDRIAKEKIFKSIDKFKGEKKLIRESYLNLKNRIGKIPYLIDFYEQGEVDPLLIIKNYQTYDNFIRTVEKEYLESPFEENEKIMLEYFSNTILSGIRPYELTILNEMIENKKIYVDALESQFVEDYDLPMAHDSFVNSIKVLQGGFTRNEKEIKRYACIDILKYDESNILTVSKKFIDQLQNKEFKKQIKDIILVGLKRYKDKYAGKQIDGRPLALYEKYSRRDISLLMNCERDESSTMFGMRRIDDDVFIFITYHKESSDDEGKYYIDGKPDYADSFSDNVVFNWESQMGRGIDSNYVHSVVEAENKHLLVKKSDAETGYYYMGQFDVAKYEPARKKNNKGKEQDTTKFEMKMKHPVRDDMLQYLQSNIETDEK